LSVNNWRKKPDSPTRAGEIITKAWSLQILRSNISLFV